MRRALRQAVAELRKSRKACREALEAWRRRVRDVVFPLGTWAMVQLHRVRVALPEPAG